MKNTLRKKTEEYLLNISREEVLKRIINAQNANITNERVVQKLNYHKKDWDKQGIQFPDKEQTINIIKQTILTPDKVFFEIDIPTVSNAFKKGLMNVKLEDITQDKYLNIKFFKAPFLVIIRDNELKSFYPVANIDKMLKNLSHSLEVKLDE